MNLSNEFIEIIKSRCVQFNYKKIDDNTFEFTIVPFKSIENIKIDIDIKKLKTGDS